MARRRTAGLASLQRAWLKLAQAGTRAGAQALAKSLKTARPAAAKAARRAKAARKPTGDERTGIESVGVAVGIGGALRYRCFVPQAGVGAERRPLLVMLHGCGQDAAGFAAATRMNRLAAQHGFCVLYPEQDRLAHAHACWHWYDTRSGRAQAEAALLLAAIDQVVGRHGLDPDRVAVAGLSAGAGMAAQLALRHPARFAAVAMHSGVAPGLADSAATALAAMRRPHAPVPLAAIALPPLLVLQGRLDAVVDARNGRIAAALWADAAGASPGPPRGVRRGSRYPATVTDWKRRGRIAATLYEIDTLGHAWSGGAAGAAYADTAGPDASRLVCAFVARQFRAVAVRAAKAALSA